MAQSVCASECAIQANSAGGESETFTHVISFGSLCATASWLQTHGLRTGSGPFDWVHSSPAMVRHCLRDNFAAYLDKSSYFCAGPRAVGHRMYSRIQMGKGRLPVWLHHDPLRKAGDYELLARSVERFRRVLRGPHGEERRKLFVICILANSALAIKTLRSNKALAPKLAPVSKLPAEDAEPSAARSVWNDTSEHINGSDETGEEETASNRADNCHSWAFGNHGQVRGLFHDLCDMGVRNFHIDVVYLCARKASRIAKGDIPFVRICATESSTSSPEAADGSGTNSYCGPTESAAASPSEAAEGTGTNTCRARETLAIHELHMVGDHTGLRFKDDRDHEVFTALVFRRSSGVCARRFVLQPQHAPSSSGARRVVGSTARRAQRYGDDLSGAKCAGRLATAAKATASMEGKRSTSSAISASKTLTIKEAFARSSGSSRPKEPNGREDPFTSVCGKRQNIVIGPAATSAASPSFAVMRGPVPAAPASGIDCFASASSCAGQEIDGRPKRKLRSGCRKRRRGVVISTAKTGDVSPVSVGSDDHVSETEASASIDHNEPASASASVALHTDDSHAQRPETRIEKVVRGPRCNASEPWRTISAESSGDRLFAKGNGLPQTPSVETLNEIEAPPRTSMQPGTQLECSGKQDHPSEHCVPLLEQAVID